MEIGWNFVKLIPSTADLYSSMLGILPKIADNTTTGVEANKDSPFLLSLSSTTRPWNKRVEVDITVSPLRAFSWLPIQRLHPGRSKYITFSYSVRAVDFGNKSLNSNPEYFCRVSQSPSAFNSSMIL